MKTELELYEILYLINPNFTEQELEEKIEYYQNFLIASGSQVVGQNRGKRNLSYTIKGFDVANYIQMMYVGNEQLIKALNVQINRDETVLRHLTTKVSKF